MTPACMYIIINDIVIWFAVCKWRVLNIVVRTHVDLSLNHINTESLVISNCQFLTVSDDCIGEKLSHQMVLNLSLDYSNLDLSLSLSLSIYIYIYIYISKVWNKIWWNEKRKILWKIELICFTLGIVLSEMECYSAKMKFRHDKEERSVFLINIYLISINYYFYSLIINVFVLLVLKFLSCIGQILPLLNELFGFISSYLCQI